MEQTQTLMESLERTARQAGRADLLAEELEALKSEMARREALLTQRVAATEGMFRAREAEWQKRSEQLELRATKAEELVRARIEAQVREKFAAEESQRVQREADLRARLAKSQAELTQAQADVSDLSTKLERVNSEHAALARWSTQLEEELGLVRPRLHELMSSRWRKYGQRMHLCMKLPWENEHAGNGQSNGKH